MEQAHQQPVQINVPLENIVPQEVHHVQIVMQDTIVVKELVHVQRVEQENGVQQVHQVVVI